MIFHTIIRNASKRVALIKFRKGGAVAGSAAPPTAPATGATNKLASLEVKPKASKIQAKGPAIEDWELHPRYARKPLDPIEIDYINRGGPA